MDQERINKDIFARLEKLEGVTFGGKKKVKAVAGGKESLADHIIALRGRTIFKEPLTPQEVHKKLESVYRCDLSRVKVGLIRLQRHGQLRKTFKLIEGKKYVAYVW